MCPQLGKRQDDEGFVLTADGLVHVGPGPYLSRPQFITPKQFKIFTEDETASVRRGILINKREVEFQF